MRISGIAVVSSIAIPEPVSLSSFQFQVSHNTSHDIMRLLHRSFHFTYLFRAGATVEWRRRRTILLLSSSPSLCVVHYNAVHVTFRGSLANQHRDDGLLFVYSARFVRSAGFH